MAAYTGSDPFAWPFKEIQPENYHVDTMSNYFDQKEDSTVYNDEENSSNFFEDLLRKLKEEKPTSTVAPTQTAVTEMASEMAASGSLESIYKANQEDFLADGGQGRTSLVPRNFFPSVTSVFKTDPETTESLFISNLSSEVTDKPFLYSDKIVDSILNDTKGVHTLYTTCTNRTATASSRTTTLASLFNLGSEEKKAGYSAESAISCEVKPPDTPLIFNKFKNNYFDFTTLVEEKKFNHSFVNDATTMVVTETTTDSFRLDNMNDMNNMNNTNDTFEMDRMNNSFGLNEMPILKNKFQMSFDEITTPYNDNGYENEGFTSTIISSSTEAVINTTSEHKRVFVHAMEESEVNNCYFYIILIVVILILLSVIAGVFLFYKKIKGAKGSGYQVSQMRDYTNAKNANETDNDMVNI
ncbi:unnamed protein product [Phyllotreta striolata]|uniref:Uncharacterized protein n=1 Tax=Phyllotreta striolata TaxID=444603 RepID=A0A9N9TP20_PHYSR|nr:unnamed protein product [Phyllotreta striolata]